MDKDLKPIIEGWDYKPGAVTVRKIIGLDGKDKIQMRLQLGLLQMESTARPDGRRPYGFPSLLEYYNSLLEKMKSEGREDLFRLSTQACADLRDEALQYYYRYLSFFDLGEYENVVRDTERNIEAFDLISMYAENDADKYSLEQYRPYVIMMNAKAKAEIARNANDLNTAYAALQDGMDGIRTFYENLGQSALAEKSDEFRQLATLSNELKIRLPRDPLDVLHERLQAAVKEERFEEAARLRDKIRKVKQQA